MQNQHETLGEIIKNARIKADMTVEILANKVGVTERFIYRIENEGKKPSYEILYKLIRELAIVPDQIFFPEKQVEESEMESLIRIKNRRYKQTVFKSLMFEAKHTEPGPNAVCI